MSDSDDRQTVLTMLARVGLEPSEAEVDRLVAGYPQTQAMLALLYSVPDGRYAEPALTFDPRMGS